VCLLLSPTPTLDPRTSRTLARVAVGPLAAGQSWSQVVSTLAPSNTPPVPNHVYQVIASADCLHDIGETDETNNLGASNPITLATPF